ncbi:MAG: restriction endonuclease [Methanomicrobia archaeon]|nr:restriction endonuclease [Methanomicrobia archaeon]
MFSTDARNVESVNLNEKIRETKKEFGFRQLSIMLFKIEGTLDLSHIDKFVKTHYIKREKISTEGFQRTPTINKNVLTAYYAKEGIRTLRFTDQYSNIVPCSIEMVPDLVKIQFIKYNDFVEIRVIGGSEKFIEKKVYPMLRIMANTAGGRLYIPTVSQEFIRKLCLFIHRKNVDYIKIDPSKSKNYAKVIEEEIKKENIKKYEYVVEEGIFKGSGILESGALKALFEKEQDIIIQEFKSKMNYLLKGEFREINYQMDSGGKIKFFVDGSFVDSFEDESEAGSYLLKRLEEDAQKQLILTEEIGIQKNNAQRTLIDFVPSKEYLLDLFINHMDTRDYKALPSILKDLKDTNVTLEEKGEILKGYIFLLENDLFSAYEYIGPFLPFFESELIRANEERLTGIFKNMEPETFFRFVKKGVEPFAEIINPIISEKEVKRYHLQRLWGNVKNEMDKIKKGKLLEDFASLLFSFDEGLKVDSQNFRTKDEEIDLLLKNKFEDHFWVQLNSPYIFVECKNWSSKVGSDEIKKFKGKLEDHRNLCRVGFFISINGFTKGDDIALIRAASQDKILSLIAGEDIQEFLYSQCSLKEFLERLIKDSIR